MASRSAIAGGASGLRQAGPRGPDVGGGRLVEGHRLGGLDLGGGAVGIAFCPGIDTGGALVRGRPGSLAGLGEAHHSIEPRPMFLPP